MSGCYVSLGNKEKAKHFFDLIPGHLDKRKFGGKELPTELLVRKRRKCSDPMTCGTTDLAAALVGAQ
jgi:hypothetical protein